VAAAAAVVPADGGAPAFGGNTVFAALIVVGDDAAAAGLMESLFCFWFLPGVLVVVIAVKEVEAEDDTDNSDNADKADNDAAADDDVSDDEADVASDRRRMGDGTSASPSVSRSVCFGMELAVMRLSAYSASSSSPSP
jgi:hypothetical protein